MTMGCIPVMFDPAADAGIWPHHWGEWREQSRLLINGAKLDPMKQDLQPFLRGIPRAQVEDMQSTIAANAHKMHYALDDVPGDALEVLLAGLVGRGYPT